MRQAKASEGRQKPARGQWMPSQLAREDELRRCGSSLRACARNGQPNELGSERARTQCSHA